MKEKVIVVAFNNALKISPVSGETILHGDKHLGIEMYIGIKPGFLSIYYQGHEIGVPFSNCNSMKLEKTEK